MIVADIQDLSVTFGGLKALDSVSLAVVEGERRAIIGPNGAGKTTLFNAISGNVYPSSGRILFLGLDITRMPPHQRSRAGLGRTFQITNLFPRLTVIENVLLALQAVESCRHSLFRRMQTFRHLYVRGEEILSRWSLAGYANVRVVELSYGDQRKLEIILALARSPRLLLLDEPAAGLATEDTSSLTALIKELSSDVTVIFIEHDLDMAFDTANRITVLHQGRIIAEGDAKEIRNNPDVAAIYLGKA